MTYKENDLCTLCGEGHFRRKEGVEVLEYKGLRESVQVVLFECDVCDEGSFYAKESEKELDSRFTEMRRRVEGLLSASDMRALRKKLDLTQEELSRLIKMDPKTIARYESGSVLQSKSADQLLRLIMTIADQPALLSAFAKESGVFLKEGQGQSKTLKPSSTRLGVNSPKRINVGSAKKARATTSKPEKEAA